MVRAAAMEASSTTRTKSPAKSRSILLLMVSWVRAVTPSIVSKRPAYEHSRLSFLADGSAELRGVDRDIQLHIGEFEGIPPIQPREGPLKWKLDSVDVAIIGVIDLSGNAAN